MSVASLETAPNASGRKTLDDYLASLEDSIPGFGGWYIGEAGELHIFLVDTTTFGRARAFLAQHPMNRGRDATRMRVHRAEYPIGHLKRWRDEIKGAVFAVPGAHTLDLDEGRNRITVEVVDEAARVELLTRALGWPVRSGALNVIVSPRPQVTATLNDYVRPLVGGTYIESSDGSILFGGCTLGLVVKDTTGVHWPAAKRYVLTNSHCTKTYFTVDSPAYTYQNSYLSGAIGFEAADPASYTGGSSGCPTGFQCRYSDAALIELYDSTATVGYIARTTYSSLTNGSLTIDTFPNDKFSLKAAGWPIDPWTHIAGIGNPIEKVGRTTGWTAGTISATCTDIAPSPFPISPPGFFFCQYKSTAYAHGGDSGSPVFYATGNTDANGRAAVAWGGLLWGNDCSNGYTNNICNPSPFIFSPLDGVAAELRIVNYWSH